MALIDGMLFVFESKNSLIPANWFELRTSFDYIKTAARQLGAFQTAFKFDEFRKRLSDKLRWTIEDETRLITSIVMMNRMFTGYRLEGHPVRGTFEILNFIDTGTVTLGNEHAKLWLGEKFTGEDLRRFLEDDILHSILWDSMVAHSDTTPIGRVDVTQETFHLDLIAFAKAMGFNEAVQILEKAQRESGATESGGEN